MCAPSITLCEQGQTLQAIETYYAQDVVVYENYERARTGREECLSYERQAVAQMKEPSTLRAKACAVDAASGVAFIEWVIRFTGEDGVRCGSMRSRGSAGSADASWKSASSTWA